MTLPIAKMILEYDFGVTKDQTLRIRHLQLHSVKEVYKEKRQRLEKIDKQKLDLMKLNEKQ